MAVDMLRLLLCIGLVNGIVDAHTHNGDASAETTILSYNMYLPGNSPTTLFYQQRREALFYAINDTRADSPFANADVVCLQEALLDVDRAEVLRRARAAGYAYSFSETLEDVSTLSGSACDGLLVTLAAGCLYGACPNSTTVAATLPCSLDVCRPTVTADRQTCLNCIGETTGSLDDVFRSCVADSAANYPTNFGLMLLSKKELSSSSIESYSNTSEVLPRAYIRSDIDGVGTVFCTHLFPFFESAPQLGVIAEATNKEQMLTLLEEAASTPYAVIAGDLNNGPANAATGVAALFPNNFALANASGFTSPYAESNSSSCTFCSTNPIQATAAVLSPGLVYADQIIDHVLIRPTEFTVNTSSTRRVFTSNTVSLSTLPGVVPLSDHFGVQVTITRIPSGSQRVSALILSLILPLLLLAL